MRSLTKVLYRPVEHFIGCVPSLFILQTFLRLVFGKSYPKETSDNLDRRFHSFRQIFPGTLQPSIAFQVEGFPARNCCHCNIFLQTVPLQKVCNRYFLHWLISYGFLNINSVFSTVQTNKGNMKFCLNTIYFKKIKFSSFCLQWNLCAQYRPLQYTGRNRVLIQRWNKQD